MLFDDYNKKRGHKSPLSFVDIMITTEKIKALVEDKLSETEVFIVDIKIKPSNAITILIDSPKGVSISNCVEVSRYVESNLNRDSEDFELNVSSPGLDQPFKVQKQYFKNIGKQVEVVTNENQKITGTLISANENEIAIETKTKQKVDGKKKKQTIINNHIINYSQINQTKIVLLF